MEIEDLRTFVEVAGSGGVSLAARRLGISKSMASRRLSRLEDGLGVKLLKRTTRGAELTEAGVMFREYAAKACFEIDMARDTIGPQRELRGRLRVAIPIAYASTHFVSVLADMARRHPHLQVNAEYGERGVDLAIGGFDCGIRDGPVADPNVIAEPVGEVSCRLVASPYYLKAHGSPEAPDDVVNHDALIGTDAWRFESDGTVFTVRPRGRFISNNSAAIAEAAAAGLGIARLPDFATDAYLKSGALIAIMTGFPPPSIDVYVVTPQNVRVSRRVRRLSDLLCASLKELRKSSDDAVNSRHP